MTPLEKLKSYIPRDLKSMFRRLLPVLRKLAVKGPSPNLLIIGVQKAATTTLSQILKSHPLICGSLVKEVHYFDLNYSKGLDWYRRFFRAGKPCKISFEATPYYFYHPLVPKRVHTTNADMKLIVILRDPVDRAYSHYQMERRRSREPLPKFEQAIAAESSRIDGDTKLLADGSISTSKAHQIYSYLARGEYEAQFRRWFEYFPRERFLVLEDRSLVNRPKEVCQQIADFLEVDNSFVVPKRKYMEGDYEPIPPDLKARLREHFQKKSPNLSKMIGTEFEWTGQE